MTKDSKNNTDIINEELHLKRLKKNDFIVDGNWLIFYKNSDKIKEMFKNLGVKTTFCGDVRGDKILENGMLYYSDHLYYVYLDDEHIKKAKSILNQQKVIGNWQFEKYSSQEEAILNKKFDGQICSVHGRGAILVGKRVVYIGELDVLTNLDVNDILEIRYNNEGKIDWLLKNDIDINTDIDNISKNISKGMSKLSPESPRYYNVEEANTYLNSHKVGDEVAILKNNKWVKCEVREQDGVKGYYTIVESSPYNFYVKFESMNNFDCNKERKEENINTDLSIKKSDLYGITSLTKAYCCDRPKYNSMEEVEKNISNHKIGDIIEVLIDDTWHTGIVLNKGTNSENKIALVDKKYIDKIYIPDISKEEIQSKIGTNKRSTNLFPESPCYYSLEEAKDYMYKYKVGDFVWILIDGKWCRCLVAQKSNHEFEYLVEVTNGEANNYLTIGEYKCRIKNKNLDIDTNIDIDIDTDSITLKAGSKIYTPNGSESEFSNINEEIKQENLEDIKTNIIEWIECRCDIKGECKLLRDLFVSSIKHYNLICLEFKQSKEKHTSLYLKTTEENPRKILLGEYEQSAQSLGQELLKKWFDYAPDLCFFEKDLILDISTLKKLSEK